MQLLTSRVLGKRSDLFAAAFDFLKVRSQRLDLTDDDRLQLKAAFMTSFEMTEEELANALGRVDKANGEVTDPLVAAREVEDELDQLLPKRGLLHDYVRFTSRSEAPLAYHVFSFLCGMGAVVNRRVYVEMGYYRVFPSIGVIILGPSGIKKTSAANIIVGVLQQLDLVKIYSEKLTPEALVEAMKQDATGLIYAPEMTVFLNKVKYNEGLVQLITRFMDCPDKWESGTIMRGKHALHNIAISSLMCSTSDWFIRSTPEDSFGGGFIARNLLVVQNNSSRCEPIPDPGDGSLRSKIVNSLASLHSLEGQMLLDKPTMSRYVDWYRGEHQDESKQPEHELLATYHNRKPDHIKRLAISLHLALHPDLVLCLDCFECALGLLNWTEQFIPGLLQQMFKSATGEEIELVHKAILAHGIVRHTDLVRKLSYRLDAARVKSIITSLKESNQVKELNDPIFGHAYQVTK